MKLEERTFGTPSIINTRFFIVHQWLLNLSLMTAREVSETKQTLP